MRLLNTLTGEFRSVEDPRHVRYAILSHVWAKVIDPGYVPEQTYQEVREIQRSARLKGENALSRLSKKIRSFCQVAHKDGFTLVWLDTACIDQTSSSELSEAINSMYNWYRYAGVCYVFLHDVKASANPHDQEDEFRASKWFRRGWTLQELLAPGVALFLSDEWTMIGSKHTLARLIADITKIDSDVLTLRVPLEAISVARRMSWAASRETTRVEDEAYSLMGIFGVNMPTTYGEGRYAFTRLQEEILKHVPDQTIFAWGTPFERTRTNQPFAFGDSSNLASQSTDAQLPQSSLHIPSSPRQYLLASSPRDFGFSSSSDLRPLSRDAFAKRLRISPKSLYHVYTTTSYGIHASFPLVAVTSLDPQTNVPTHLAILACEDRHQRLVALLLRPQAEASGTGYLVGTIVGRVNDLIWTDGQYATLWPHYFRTTYLTDNEVDFCSREQAVLLEDVYIPHRPSHTSNEPQTDSSILTDVHSARDAFEVRLFPWSRELLSSQEFVVAPTDDKDIAVRDGDLRRALSTRTSGIVIASGSEYITIQIGRCNCEFGRPSGPSGYGLLGVLVASRYSTCSLEEAFAREPHTINHPVHVYSWAHRGRVASTELTLTSSRTGGDITMRLTLSHEVLESTVAHKKFRLGVELWVAPLYHSDSALSTYSEGLPVLGWTERTPADVPPSPPVALGQGQPIRVHQDPRSIPSSKTSLQPPQPIRTDTTLHPSGSSFAFGYHPYHNHPHGGASGSTSRRAYTPEPLRRHDLTEEHLQRARSVDHVLSDYHRPGDRRQRSRSKHRQEETVYADERQMDSNWTHQPSRAQHAQVVEPYTSDTFVVAGYHPTSETHIISAREPEYSRPPPTTAVNPKWEHRSSQDGVTRQKTNDLYEAFRMGNPGPLGGATRLPLVESDDEQEPEPTEPTEVPRVLRESPLHMYHESKPATLIVSDHTALREEQRGSSVYRPGNARTYPLNSRKAAAPPLPDDWASYHDTPRGQAMRDTAGPSASFEHHPESVPGTGRSLRSATMGESRHWDLEASVAAPADSHGQGTRSGVRAKESLSASKIHVSGPVASNSSHSDAGVPSYPGPVTVIVHGRAASDNPSDQQPEHTLRDQKAPSKLKRRSGLLSFFKKATSF